MQKKLVTYPDDELDVGLGGPAAKELEGAGDVHGADLLEVFSLGAVLGLEEIEDTVQALLLNGLDLDRLEDLSGGLLQLLHLYLLVILGNA